MPIITEEWIHDKSNPLFPLIGLKAQDGIVLAAERRVVSKLLAPSKTSEKTYTLDGHLSCLVAGLNADANILIQQSRMASQRCNRRNACFLRFILIHSFTDGLTSYLMQAYLINIKCRLFYLRNEYIIFTFFFISYVIIRYLFDYQEPIPVENMVKVVCNYKQAYTQYGGLRPFGVAFLFAGWDKHHGFQLYQVSKLIIALSMFIYLSIIVLWYAIFFHFCSDDLLLHTNIRQKSYLTLVRLNISLLIINIP